MANNDVYKQYIYKNGEFRKVGGGIGGSGSGANVSIVNELPQVGTENTIYLIEDTGEEEITGEANRLEFEHIQLNRLNGKKFDPSKDFGQILKTEDKTHYFFNENCNPENIEIEFKSKPISPVQEAEIAANKLVIRFDYPVKFGKRHQKSGGGKRGFVRKLYDNDRDGNVIRLNDADFLINSLVHILPEDIKTNVGGQKYILKKIPMVDLMNKFYRVEKKGIRSKGEPRIEEEILTPFHTMSDDLMESINDYGDSMRDTGGSYIYFNDEKQCYISYDSNPFECKSPFSKNYRAFFCVELDGDFSWAREENIIGGLRFATRFFRDKSARNFNRSDSIVGAGKYSFGELAYFDSEENKYAIIDSLKAGNVTISSAYEEVSDIANYRNSFCAHYYISSNGSFIHYIFPLSVTPRFAVLNDNYDSPNTLMWAKKYSASEQSIWCNNTVVVYDYETNKIFIPFQIRVKPTNVKYLKAKKTRYDNVYVHTK